MRLTALKIAKIIENLGTLTLTDKAKLIVCVVPWGPVDHDPHFSVIIRFFPLTKMFLFNEKNNNEQTGDSYKNEEILLLAWA